MKKGGYKIIDFNGATLSGTAEEITGIYEDIVNNYDKAILVSGVSLNGELQDDAYASVKVNDSSVELTVYGGVITVTEDDEVTFTVSMTIPEVENILKNLGYPLSSDIKSNVDLNTIVNSGFYSLGSGLTNAPEQFITLIVVGSSSLQLTQFAINSGKFYSRDRRSNVWSSWKKLEFATIS